jgi:hypothetical protein
MARCVMCPLHSARSLKSRPPATTIFFYFAALSCECRDGWQPHQRRPADSLNMMCESSVLEQAAGLKPVMNDISVSTSPQSSDRFVSVLRGLTCSRLMWLPAVMLSVVSRNVSVENRQHYYVITWRFHKARNWQIYWFIMHMYMLNAI